MLVRWQLFPYFYFLLSLPLLSFSSLPNIPYLTFLKVIVSLSISPLCFSLSIFLPISLSPFSLSLFPSLSFSVLFFLTDWVLKVTCDRDLWESSLRYLFQITSLALSCFTCKIVFPEIMTFPQEWRTGKQKMTFVFIKKISMVKKCWELLWRFSYFKLQMKGSYLQLLSVSQIFSDFILQKLPLASSISHFKHEMPRQIMQFLGKKSELPPHYC